MARLDIHFVDPDGQCVQTLQVDRGDMTEDEIVSDLSANKPAGQTLAFPAKDHVCAEPPPDPLQPKRDRLEQLRTKGWGKLSAAEKDEVTGLRFDLGL